MPSDHQSQQKEPASFDQQPSTSAHPHKTDSFWGGIIKSMGLVFGDIGTSPIYTLTVVVAFAKPTTESIYGILSLIVWTLTILVSIGYAWLAMSLGRKGEGGTIVLREILVRMLKPGRQLAFVTFLSYIGVSLLLGDGVITPAISILSAVEGMHLIPGFEDISQNVIIAVAVTIAIGLFIFQYKGTDKVAKAFGPLMILWFLALTVPGSISIAAHPEVLKALSPWYAIEFLASNGWRVSLFSRRSSSVPRAVKHFMPTWGTSAANRSSVPGTLSLSLW